MNEESAALINAIRGPILVITVGILLALDQFTGVSFRQTWPALLIVAGILSLGQWAGRRPTK
jgi:hypothetical protein